MNERIKELMDQARDKTPKGISFDTGLSSYSKRFAELIVKECGVALSPMLRDMVSRGQAFELIKEHFGVEE